MMRLNVNDEARDMACRDLADLWRAETAELELPNPKGFAIALNGAVVRRDAWGDTALRDGDRIEIIRAMQGG
jgi:sulfur carrier protein